MASEHHDGGDAEAGKKVLRGILCFKVKKYGHYAKKKSLYRNGGKRK